jgi:hypothetical protein
VCDAFKLKEEKETLKLKDYVNVTFDTSPATKEKYLRLSERMRKSLKRLYKKAKR